MSGPCGRISTCESAKVDKRIAELEREKYPLYRRETAERPQHVGAAPYADQETVVAAGKLARVRQRVGELRRHKVEMRRKYRYEAAYDPAGDRPYRTAAGGRAAETKKVGEKLRRFHETPYLCRVRRRGRFLEVGSGADCARTTPSGALEVELVPRSGRHTILFGRIEQVERKFDKLLRFYRNGLQNIGWDAIQDDRYQIQGSGGLQEIKGNIPWKERIIPLPSTWALVERRGGCRREGRRRADGGGVDRVEAR